MRRNAPLYCTPHLIARARPTSTDSVSPSSEPKDGTEDIVALDLMDEGKSHMTAPVEPEQFTKELVLQGVAGKGDGVCWRANVPRRDHGEHDHPCHRAAAHRQQAKPVDEAGQTNGPPALRQMPAQQAKAFAQHLLPPFPPPGEQHLQIVDRVAVKPEH